MAPSDRAAALLGMMGLLIVYNEAASFELPTTLAHDSCWKVEGDHLTFPEEEGGSYNVANDMPENPPPRVSPAMASNPNSSVKKCKTMGRSTALPYKLCLPCPVMTRRSAASAKRSR